VRILAIIREEREADSQVTTTTQSSTASEVAGIVRAVVDRQFGDVFPLFMRGHEMQFTRVGFAHLVSLSHDAETLYIQTDSGVFSRWIYNYMISVQSPVADDVQWVPFQYVNQLNPDRVILLEIGKISPRGVIFKQPAVGLRREFRPF
jgi:hypothetical protein